MVQNVEGPGFGKQSKMFFQLHELLHHDKDEGSQIAVIELGKTWEECMANWYRIDHLPYQEQLDTFMKRQVYCAKQRNSLKKRLHKHKSVNRNNRDHHWAKTLKLLEVAYEKASMVYDEAVKEKEDFKADYGNTDSDNAILTPFGG